MKLISILIILSLISCKNKTQLEKLISSFAKEKIELSALVSINQNPPVRVAKIKRKNHLEELKLNGRVLSTTKIYHDIYAVGDVYYKVNTCSGNWDPNDLESIYFNKDGFVTKTVFVNARYNSSTTRIFNYGAENKPTPGSTFLPKNYSEGIAEINFFGRLSDPYFRKDSIISVFDTRGYLIEKKMVDIKSGETKSTVNLVYEFDKKGNWIKCMLYQNEIPIGINERIIEYYD